LEKEKRNLLNAISGAPKRKGARFAMARSLGLLLLCGISHVLVLPIPVAAENESNLPFRGERATQSKADKPNIVLVLVDDQGHGDIGLDDEFSIFQSEFHFQLRRFQKGNEKFEGSYVH
jgi:hypothetical protein